MPWYRVDDAFATNKKVLRIPLKRRCAAVGLWTLVGTWCAQELTDGHVPDYVIEGFGGTKRMVDDLVSAELWQPLPSGYLYPNWGTYQPLRSETEGKRAAARERMRRVRGGSREQGANDARTNSEVRLTPTRPDPTRTHVPTEHVGAKPPKRATALPDGWEPNASHRDYAKVNGIDVAHEAGQFRAHHTAKGSTFKSWDAAFRTWLGNAKKWAPASSAARPAALLNPPRPPDDMPDHLFRAWNQAHADAHANGTRPPSDWRELREAS